MIGEKIALKKAFLSAMCVVAMFTASTIACSVGRANPTSGPVSTETVRSYPTWTPTPSEESTTATTIRSQSEFSERIRIVDEKVQDWKIRYDAKVSPIYLIDEDNYSIFHGSHVIAMGNVDVSFWWIDVTTGEHVGRLLVVEVDGPPDVEGNANSGFLNAIIEPVDRYEASWHEDKILFVGEVFRFEEEDEIPHSPIYVFVKEFVILDRKSGQLVATNPLGLSALTSESSLTVNRNVNVREGPSTSYAVIGGASTGQQFSITGKNPVGDWWEIDYGGRKGWVYAQLVTATNTENIQVVTSIPPPPSTATPIPILGSDRNSAISLGQSAKVGDWEITVLELYPHSWNAIRQANMFNEPPGSGMQFFMATVKTRFVGPDSASSMFEVNMEALGSRNTVYREGCGVLPNALPMAELFTGGEETGNVCWEIGNEEAGLLIMRVSTGYLARESVVWFSLHR